MTKSKHLKRLVRARMSKTGEGYTAARRSIVDAAGADPASLFDGYLHLPGRNPYTAALRILLAQAGVEAPHTGRPFSEAMVLGLGGGIGIGVFSFRYEKEDVSTFYVAGRHLWQDDRAFLAEACRRTGTVPAWAETSGSKRAEADLLERLAGGSPAIAWVDAAELGYRAMPPVWVGGAYHVVAVGGIDEEAGRTYLSDLADDPVAVSLETLAAARARIRKQKNRLMWLDSVTGRVDLERAVREAVSSCRDSLTGQRMKNFTLEALRRWAHDLQGGRGEESWIRRFRPGAALWRGLYSINDFIENYGTGSGLLRPLYAEFLAEAHEALGDSSLAESAERYQALGGMWSELANAALPGTVGPLSETRALLQNKQRLYLRKGASATEELRGVWDRLDEIEEEMRESFPLSRPESEGLLAHLSGRVLDIYELEKAALDSLVTAR